MSSILLSHNSNSFVNQIILKILLHHTFDNMVPPKSTAPAPVSAKKSTDKKSVTALLKQARKAKLAKFEDYKKKRAAVKPAKRPKQVSSALKKIIVHRRTKPLYVKLKALAKKRGVPVDNVLVKRKRFTVKKVKGAQNGGERKVIVRRGPKFYPTETRPKKSKTGRVIHKNHPRKFKKGLEPGRVLIILAGKHHGKRVVLLKTLKSGLLLVNGPFKLNACPLKRMHQKFVIVTRTKIPLDGVKVPKHINDKYFKSKKVISSKGKKTKQGGNIFAKGKKTASSKPNRVRGEDQRVVDKLVLKAIKEKMGDKKTILAYLGSFFYLRNHMYPHKLKF